MYFGLLNKRLDVSFMDSNQLRDFSEILSDFGVDHCYFEYGSSTEILCDSYNYLVTATTYAAFSAKFCGKDFSSYRDFIWETLETCCSTCDEDDVEE